MMSPQWTPILVRYCEIEGCQKPAKLSKSRSTGGTGKWGYSYGKYCPMHYQRRYAGGGIGPPKVRRGEAWLGSNGYLKFSKCGREEYLHREVWILANGAIPDGFYIHHKNGLKTDNRIENLLLLSADEHIRLHTKKGDWTA